MIPEPVLRILRHPDSNKVLSVVSPDGFPHSIVLGALMADDEDRIYVGEAFMYRTAKYLEESPNAEFLVWKGKDGYSYITQIGTGNYNEKTAGLYTDLCLMTSNNDIAQDACEVFRTLSMGELVENSKALMVAPHCLQNKVVELMDNEISIARAGGEGYVAAKLNSLTDKVLMDKIIECSQAGVKVELVIRGISCLVAGVEGVTDNVQIRSIVGRYLEHARIYIFGTGVRKKVYISSADYMTRNTTRRVEVAAPILSEEVKKRVLDIFDTQMQDNVKARIMQPDGKYVRAERGDIAIDAQSRFYAEAYANAPKPAPVNDSKAVEPEKEKKGFLGWLKRLFRRKKK